MTDTSSRPRLLVSNDDGVNAPGLLALVAALNQADCFQVVVLGPDRERSAQSHAISLGKPLTCTPINVPGVREAYAVDGTPADSVMLALNSDILQSGVDLVVSGINRGDNCGLHVIYSGTVGAAREATCKGVTAVAVSLDNHTARSVDDYKAAATYTVALLKAILGLLPGSEDIRPRLTGCTVNVNVPGGDSGGIKGLHLTHQGTACVFPAFREVYQQVAQLPVEDQPGSPSSAAQPIIEQDPRAVSPGTSSRVFRNAAGNMQWDTTVGSDTWAVHEGWVSVTPLGLQSDIVFGQEAAARESSTVPVALAGAVQIAATALGVAAVGLAKL